MATVFRCCNGLCKHLDGLDCTAEEIEIGNGGECKTFEFKDDEEEDNTL